MPNLGYTTACKRCDSTGNNQKQQLSTEKNDIRVDANWVKAKVNVKVKNKARIQPTERKQKDI